MRCLDKHWDQLWPGMPSEFSAKLKDHLVPVDIDNAVRWFYEKNSQEIWDYELDFPCPLSPWNMAWFESGMPRFSNNEGRKVDLSPNNSLARKIGWQVIQIPFKKPDIPRENLALEIIRSSMALAGARPDKLPRYEYSDEQMAAIKARGPAFIQWAMLYSFSWEDKATPLMIEYAYHDSAGVMITQSRGGILVAPNQDKMTDEEKRQAGRELAASFLCLYFSLCLLHTKNVSIKDEPCPFSHKKKKGSAETKAKGTRFKVLDIAPLKEQVRYTVKSGGGEPDSEIKRALHICRGHYRRYTEDSKLFGKHTGIFWIPAHARGSKDIGEIKKDYRIITPEAR